MSESRRTVLDYVVAGTLAAAVLAAAAGSSIQYDVLAAGRPARWVALGALGVVALVRALAFRSEWRLRPRVAGGLVFLCALCFVSSAWSILPRTSAERAASVSLVIAVSATLAGSAALSEPTARRFLDGLLAAVGVVACAGFVFWLVDPARAIQAASTDYPARFRGFEQNPNTAAMLLAVGMPLALAGAIRASGARRRVVPVALLLAFTAEIVAAGSRGALVAGFLSLFVVLALEAGPRSRRAAVALTAVAALVVSAWAMTLPRALSSPPAAAQAAVRFPVDAETVIPLGAEIGGPWWTHTSGAIHRSLFRAGPRMRALSGTIEQGLGRPLGGYGFGAEQGVFVNRYYGFSSENPENGYVGLFLQFGVAGLLTFLVVASLCILPALRGAGRRNGWAPAAVGAASAGLFLGVSQSYFHAAGNIALLAFWVSLVLASVTGMRPLREAPA